MEEVWRPVKGYESLYGRKWRYAEVTACSV